MGKEKDLQNNLGESKELEAWQAWLDEEGKMVKEGKKCWVSFPDSPPKQRMM